MRRTIFDLDVLRTFATGMELGNFARAAEPVSRSREVAELHSGRKGSENIEIEDRPSHHFRPVFVLSLIHI